MGRSSSAKKVARLAERGKGKKVRFQGGSVFPFIIVGVILAGIGLVWYARATVPGLDAVAEADRQARVAHGFYLCDEWVVLDELAIDDAQAFDDYGVARLDEGVTLMNSLPADGTRGPRLGNLAAAYGVELSDTRLRLPEGLGAEDVYESGTTRCGNRTGTLSVIVWDSYDDTGSGARSIAALSDVRLSTNGMVVAVAFTEANADVPLPPSAVTLGEVLNPAAGPTLPDAPAEGDEPAGDEPAGEEPEPTGDEPADGDTPADDGTSDTEEPATDSGSG